MNHTNKYELLQTHKAEKIVSLFLMGQQSSLRAGGRGVHTCLSQCLSTDMKTSGNREES